AIQSRIRQRAFEISLSRPVDAHAAYDWIAAESEIISVPSAELIEKDGVFELKFAIAGVNPDDVNVMVTPEQVLLRAESSHQHDSSAGTIHICDFKSATIFRAVNLPGTIDVDSVKVDFADGMVHITAARHGDEQAKPKRVARKAPAKKSRA